MKFRIEKSLGRISAKEIKINECNDCVYYFQFDTSKGPIKFCIGNHEGIDVKINGWTFPWCFDVVSKWYGTNNNGDPYYHTISFDVLDKQGQLQHLHSIRLFAKADQDRLFVMSLFKTLYYMSFCDSIEEFDKLYKYIISTKRVFWGSAHEVMSFVEKFSDNLLDKKDSLFIQDLKDELQSHYEEAKKLILNSPSPIL